MSTASTLRGHPIVYANGAWRYQDTGEPTAGEHRDCGHCGPPDTPEGHDGCLGTLPGVMNACCGHGEGRRIAGEDAMREFARLRQHRLTHRHIDAINQPRAPDEGVESARVTRALHRKRATAILTMPNKPAAPPLPLHGAEWPPLSLRPNAGAGACRFHP